MPLPTTKTKPSEVVSDYKILIYGPPKIGKSTWCSQMEKPIFLATEPGLGALECFSVTIPDWNTLLLTAKELATEKHEFMNMVIDTADNMFLLCAEFICAKHGVTYLGDLAHGKGWAMAGNEFHRVLTKLASLPLGIVLVSHSVEREIETSLGTKTKIQPTLPDRAKRIVLGMVDFIFYCDVEEGLTADGKIQMKRVIRTKPTSRYEAGDRTGRLPETIEMNYDKFKTAFADKKGQKEKETKK